MGRLADALEQVRAKQENLYHERTEIIRWWREPDVQTMVPLAIRGLTTRRYSWFLEKVTNKK